MTRPEFSKIKEGSTVTIALNGRTVTKEIATKRRVGVSGDVAEIQVYGPRNQLILIPENRIVEINY